MTIVMTMAGVNCNAKVLDNEITCRIPRNMSIPSEGLPVKVGQSSGPTLNPSFVLTGRCQTENTARVSVNSVDNY